MDTIHKISICCVIAAILIAAVRSRNREMGMIISLAACALALLAGLPFFQDGIAFLNRLGEEAGLRSPLLSVLLKVCFVSLVVKIFSSFCEDAGESSLAKIVVLCGNAAALCVSMPLLEMLLDLLRELTGNL